MLEDFEKILEESLLNPETAKMIREKEVAGQTDKIPAGEVTKNFPLPQREIDLHGHTGPEAMAELVHFIGQAILQRVRTVRVITGKGQHSKNLKSVLPEMTEKKLAEFRRAGKVLAFRREKTGGSFVVYLVS